jgi:hypothetical protein
MDKIAQHLGTTPVRSKPPGKLLELKNSSKPLGNLLMHAASHFKLKLLHLVDNA